MFFFLQTEIGISPFPQKCVRPWKCQATHRSSDVQQDVWNAKQTWPALLQKLAVLVAAGCIMSCCRECLCTEQTLLRKWCMVKAKAVQCFCVCVTKTVFQNILCFSEERKSSGSQSNRAPLGCGGTEDLHHGCAADKLLITSIWTKISEECFQHLVRHF